MTTFSKKKIISQGGGSMSTPGGGTPVGIIGNGTPNKLAKFTAGTTIGDSQIIDNASAVGIGTILPTYRLDILSDNTLNILRANSTTTETSFYDGLTISNNGSFQSASGVVGAGAGTFTTDHLTYTFNTSYQTYLAFTNAGAAGNKGGYGIIGDPLTSANSNYRLSLLNNDNGTLGSTLWIGSTAGYSGNDGFDTTSYGVNITSNGVQANSGAGIAYKVGINLDITNADINRAINVENGVIRIVKANQPLYASLTSGDLYYDTAANILANGDFVVGMKA